MNNVKVVATKDVRGELVLGTLGPTVALKAGSEVTLTEKQYWADDVQRCLTMKPAKLKVVEGNINPNPEYTDIVAIMCIRPGKSVLTLPTIPKGMVYGQMIELPLRLYKNTDIQQAQVRGFIKTLTQEEYEAVMERDAKIAADAAAVVADASTPLNPRPVASNEDPMAIRHLRSISETGQKQQVHTEKLNSNADIAAIRPEAVDVDVEVLDEAERFRLTGQAKMIKHRLQENTVQPYDPRPSVPAIAKNASGPKRVIKRAGNVPGTGGGEVDDGVNIDVF